MAVPRDFRTNGEWVEDKRLQGRWINIRTGVIHVVNQ